MRYGRLTPSQWTPSTTTFNEYADRFDLFDPDRPFGQFWEDKRVRQKSVVSLQHGFGMTPSSWFDHNVAIAESLPVRLTPAQAARDLITVLAFGFGGLSGIPRISHTDAICTKGVIFMVQGATLRETLLLNLDRYVNDWDGEDKPTWEVEDPESDLIEVGRSEPEGRLDRFTYASRSVRLYLNPVKLEQGELEVHQYRLGVGLRTGETTEPMKHYFQSKSSGLLPLSFDEERQLWRNCAALFAMQPEKGEAARNFYVAAHLARAWLFVSA